MTLARPSAVVFSLAVRGLSADALLLNFTIAAALRGAVAAVLLPPGYPPDAVFISAVRNSSGMVGRPTAEGPVNRAGGRYASLDAVMEFCGWGGTSIADGEFDGNSTLALSDKTDSVTPRLDLSSLRVTFNLIAREGTDNGAVLIRARALVPPPGRQRALLGGASDALSNSVAGALANATGRPAGAFSAYLSPPTVETAPLSYTRSRWRRFFDWILNNAWMVIGVSGGLCVCVVGTAAVRDPLRRGCAGPSPRAQRREKALKVLEARTKKWRGAGLEKRGGGAVSLAETSEALPVAPAADDSAFATLPSDAGSTGAGALSAASVGSLASLGDALDGVAGAAAAAVAGAPPAPPAPRRPRALPRATAAAPPHSFSKRLVPAALPPLRPAHLLAEAEPREVGEAPPEVREVVVQRAAGRSLAARARAAAAVKRLATVENDAEE